MPETVSAPIKSAWASKINWLQVVSLAASGLAMFGFTLDDKTKADLVGGINAVVAIVTMFLRTYATTSITKNSAPGNGA